jgi:hypothetical protein
LVVDPPELVVDPPESFVDPPELEDDPPFDGVPVLEDVLPPLALGLVDPPDPVLVVAEGVPPPPSVPALSAAFVEPPRPQTAPSQCVPGSPESVEQAARTPIAIAPLSAIAPVSRANISARGTTKLRVRIDGWAHRRRLAAQESTRTGCVPQVLATTSASEAVG